MNNAVTNERSFFLYQLPERLSSCNQIYIYGAGMVGKFIFNYLKDNELADKIASYVISSPNSEGMNPDKVYDKEVKTINNAKISDDDVVLLAALTPTRKEMIQSCREHNIKNFIEIDLFDERAFFKGITVEEYPLMLKIWYKMKTGKDLNLEHPRTFNEKIQWLKLYDRDPLRTQLTDKYLVRDYIKDKIGEEYLIPLLGVWDKFDDINFDELPNKFVLKCNHGSGWNLVVQDKFQLDISKAKSKFDRWMAANFAFNGLQMQYENIVPKIIAEQYIENQTGDLWDYKFWCFDGKVENIMFLSNRKQHLCKNNFDRNWNPQKFTSSKYPGSNQVIEKPSNLDEMIDLSENLSKGFNFVRIDLYRLNDASIKFGEFTFTPLNGIYTWNPEEMDDYFGALIKLPIDQ